MSLYAVTRSLVGFRVGDVDSLPACLAVEVASAAPFLYHLKCPIMPCSRRTSADVRVGGGVQYLNLRVLSLQGC